MKVMASTVARLQEARSRIRASAGVDVGSVGFGSTPSCSVVDAAGAADAWAGADEVHPGNYVFYDAEQWRVRKKVRNPFGKRRRVQTNFTAWLLQGGGHRRTGHDQGPGSPAAKVKILIFCLSDGSMFIV